MSDWRDIVLHGFTPEQREEVEREGERIAMESRTLAEIRKMEQLTQAELAARLGVTQGALSQMETKGDARVSALRQIIESMGGSLQIVAELPGKPPVRISGLD